MEIEKDFRELLELFNGHNVAYLVVDAYALADFGFGSPDLTVDDFIKPDSVVQLGLPPVRIDIITSLTGVSWDDADKGKCKGTYGGCPAFFLGKAEFIANKRALARKKDLADLEALGEE